MNERNYSNGLPVYSNLYDRLIRGDDKLALVGLGYVGMLIAVEFAKHVKAIEFNHNERRNQGLEKMRLSH